jgi:hypothetical protein
VGQLINRRRRYPVTFRRILNEKMLLRQSADYETDSISEIQAYRAVRRTWEFVKAIRSNAMTSVHDQQTNPRMQAAVAEWQALILAHYPSTTFIVGGAEDPEGVYVQAVVDVDDPDEVAEVFIDRMIDLQVEDGLPIYVVPVRTPERRAALRQRQAAARTISV